VENKNSLFEQNLRSLIEAISEGLLVIRENGDIVYANDATAGILGYTREELFVKKIGDIETIRENHKYYLGDFDDQSIKLSSAFRRKTGTTINVEATLAVFKGDLEKTVYCLWRDISEYSRIEKDLWESKEKLHAILEMIGVGVSLISPQMEILMLNRQMRQWFPGLDLKAKPVCYRAFNRPPREHVCTYCPTALTLADGLMHEAVTETPVNGKTVNYRVIASPIKDKNNKVVAAIEMVDDITVQLNALNLLRESEEKFRTLVDNIPGAVYRCLNDKDWTMEFLSDAITGISGYPASDFIKNSVRTFADIIHPQDREMVGAVITEALRRRMPFSIEYRILDAQAQVRWVFQKGQGIFGAAGNLLNLVGAICDMTEQKKMGQEIKNIKQNMGLFYKAAQSREEEITNLKNTIKELETKLREKT
jgi:PAS domain S-box-containing protein